MALVRAGDRLARLVWQRYVDRLARGLALALNVLDPDVLVMADAGYELYTIRDCLRAPLCDLVEARLPSLSSR